MEYINVLIKYQFIIGIIIGSIAVIGLLLYIDYKQQVKTKLLDFRSDVFIKGDIGSEMINDSRKNDINHISFYAQIIFDNLTNRPKRFYDFKVIFTKQNNAIYAVQKDNSQEAILINKKTHIFCEDKYINVLPKEVKETTIQIYINVNDYNKIQDADGINLIYHDVRNKRYKMILFKGSIKNTIRTKFFES